MQISFTPQRSDAAFALSRSGDVLTINGEIFDFSDIPEGGTCPREAVGCDWLASDVVREGGVIRLTLIRPHGPDAPQQTLFPGPAMPGGAASTSRHKGSDRSTNSGASGRGPSRAISPRTTL